LCCIHVTFALFYCLLFNLNLNSYEFEFKLNVFEFFQKWKSLPFSPLLFSPAGPSLLFLFSLFLPRPKLLVGPAFSLPWPIFARWPVLHLPSLPSHYQQALPIGCFFLPCAGRTLAKPESGPATSSPALALTPRRPAAPIKRTARTPLDPEPKPPPPRLPKP